MTDRPYVLALGGPNGAGKTTIARAVISDAAGLSEFVNADVIAQGLSGFSPEHAAFAAGRIMLARLRELAAARVSFAFESTLASRTFAPWLSHLKSTGYDFRLIYVWLKSPDFAVRRVQSRVRQGGHSVPSEIIRRRFARSVRNFCMLYMPIASSWRVYDNSRVVPAAVAAGVRGGPATIYQPGTWAEMQRIARYEEDERPEIEQ